MVKELRHAGRPASGQPAASEHAPEALDLSEKGRGPDGEVITSERRLFMQFLAFGNVRDHQAIIDLLAARDFQGALYMDLNDPYGIGLVALAESADYFLTDLRELLGTTPFVELTPKPELTMFGRTYALGYEPDLDETLVDRPRSRVIDPALPWVIWYPLRRAGTFEQLSPQEQNVILMEHGGIGRAFGRAGLGYDVRLACHGLDKHDNDFVIGLIGPELVPLSQIVQRMRKTKQTSLHLERLGPFFVGKVAWQTPQAIAA
ncbi:MAG: chlorite dismutase family protein [Litorilinea sp.]